ncbi:N-6 DNA methylase [Micromonospora sp. CA-259024]|uniref:N-6 DNA methylase n=1 Tax=Micromonospora sp. CA-259024 TaxID=3239965 RepID=UPI003D8E3E27
MASPGSASAGDGSHQVATRAEIARAADVADQAVSNWVRRYAEFPQPVRLDRQVVYPVAEVAAWLDTRTIHRDALLPGELPGQTYGQRLRTALGLPTNIPPTEHVELTPPKQLVTRLWEPLDKLRRNSEDPESYQGIVLSLLCMQQTDPDSWAAIAKASVDTITDTVATAWRRQPQYLRRAYAALHEAPATAWWRHRLVQIVTILAGQTRPSLRPPGSALSDRISAVDAFDHLLDRFARARHSSPDAYLVPDRLAQLMAGLAEPQPGGRIHDPCCGSGELLVAALAQVRHRAPAASALRLSGRAMTGRTWRLAAMNITIHGGRADLGTGPSDDPAEVAAGEGPYDVVLVNPPFNSVRWQLAAPERQRPWPYGAPPEHSANFAWLQLAVTALAPGGRAVVLMPGGIAATHNPREQAIRNAVVDQGVVRCVVELPGHLFRETTIPVSVWVLRAAADDSRPDILLMDARRAACQDGRTHRVLTATGCEAILTTYSSWLTGTFDQTSSADGITATAVPIDRICRSGYQLHPDAYLRPQAATRPLSGNPQADLDRLLGELHRLEQQARAAHLRLEDQLERLRPWTP